MTFVLVNVQHPKTGCQTRFMPDFDRAIVAAGKAGNIDPCHICHHRSCMNQSPPPYRSFSIGRHAVQQLLRLALDAGPEPVRGLLGGREHCVESVLAVHADDDTDMIRTAIQAWYAEGLQLLAAYSSGDTARVMTAAGLLPGGETAELPQLVISTDTLGRIEASLFACDTQGKPHACILEMQEDGGLYPLQDKD